MNLVSYGMKRGTKHSLWPLTTVSLSYRFSFRHFINFRLKPRLSYNFYTTFLSSLHSFVEWNVYVWMMVKITSSVFFQCNQVEESQDLEASLTEILMSCFPKRVFVYLYPFYFNIWVSADFPAPVVKLHVQFVKKWIWLWQVIEFARYDKRPLVIFKLPKQFSCHSRD